MAKPLPVDWDAIRLAYVAGATHSDLATTYHISKGTIAAKCARQEWDRYRQTARGAASAIVKLDPDTKKPELQAGASGASRTDNFAMALRIKAREWLARSADSATKDADRIEKIWERKAEDAEPSDALTLTRAADIVDQRARRALGLDNQENTGLSVHLYLSDPAPDAQVIDVQPVAP